MSDDFGRFADLIRKTSGIVIDPDKRFVLEARLSSTARAHGHESVAALVNQLVTTRRAELLNDVIDALTTNETFFFRDRTPFELFGTLILPYLLRARADRRSLRIWCNACSTGQEPYSIAMTLDQFAPKLQGWRVSLQGTDVSSRAIMSAREGLYNQFEVQRGMPANFLLRYFQKEGENWRIAEHLRQKARFTKFNLLDDFSGRGEFDVIFCRNVLIYFDAPTKRDILARLAKIIRKDGFLILGSTETAVSGDGEWIATAAHPMLHVRSDGPHAGGMEKAAS